MASTISADWPHVHLQQRLDHDSKREPHHLAIDVDVGGVVVLAPVLPAEIRPFAGRHHRRRVATDERPIDIWVNPEICPEDPSVCRLCRDAS